MMGPYEIAYYFRQAMLLCKRHTVGDMPDDLMRTFLWSELCMELYSRGLVFGKH